MIARVLRSGRPERTEYAGAGGALAETLQSAGYRGAVAAPVLVGGRLWGALAAGTRTPESLPDGAERRLGDFAELVAQAIANTDAHEQLAASRARIVEAGDAERRRLERNLHDGAQQRLVSVAIDLRVIRATVGKDPEKAAEQLSAAQEQLAQGLDDLRELARGIHPAVLTDRGLGPASRSSGRSVISTGTGARIASDSRARSRRPRTTSSPRRSRTSPSTRRPRTRPSACAVPTGARRSRSPTTASAARTPRGAPACAASPTGSRRSTGTSTSRARPRAGPGSAPRSPAADRPAAQGI